MFGAADDEKDPAKRKRLQSYEKSILDLVVADAQSLKTSLGGSDRQKLDQYLSSIRDIEKRIQQVEKTNAQNPFPVKISMEVPSGSIPTDFTEHSHLMLDLTALAFQTDQTRIITVLLGLEQSPRNYPEIGITEGHHGLTHHQGDKEKIEKVTQINEYHIKQFTYLLDKLKVDAGWRRHAARPFDDRLRQRAGRRQRASAQQPADGDCGRAATAR